MIVDRITNWRLYRGLPARLARALEFLHDADVAALPLGRLDLDGDRLFALVQEYSTRPTDACKWEAHRRYCDVQFVAEGIERIGVANIETMRVEQAYDEDKDFALFAGEGDFVTLRAGSFAIFAPADVHMPCVAAAEPARVRKIVVKAEVES